MQRQDAQDQVSQRSGLLGRTQRWRWRGAGRSLKRGLGHLAGHASPALVALTGELVPHVQDVVVVEVAAEVEAPAPGDGEVAGVEVQLRPGVQALADAPAVLLAERLAA